MIDFEELYDRPLSRIRLCVFQPSPASFRVHVQSLASSHAFATVHGACSQLTDLMSTPFAVLQ